MLPEEFRALPEDQQDEMTEYVFEVCPDCGNLRSVCSNPEETIYPQRSYCYPSAVKAATWRRIEALYSPPDPKSGELHFVDGLKVGTSMYDLTPDDGFLDTPEQAALRAIGSTGAQEAAGDEH